MTKIFHSRATVRATVIHFDSSIFVELMNQNSVNIASKKMMKIMLDDLYYKCSKK